MPSSKPAAGQPNAGIRKLRLLPLLAATYFMVSGGPYDLEDIIGFGGYGRALWLLCLLPFFWSFPTALMLGELASAVPAEGGFYAWVRRAMGPFWGFQEAWLSLSASVFDMAIYPTTFVLYLSHLAPSLTRGHRGILLELAVVAAAVIWNLRGAAAVGEGSVRLWIFAISPFLILIVAAIFMGLRGAHGTFGGHASFAAPEGKAFSTAILVAMWNYMGWDNATTIANEVENPQRNYPRVILLAAVMVMLTYVVPIVAVAWAGIPAERFSTGAWVDAAHILGGSALAVGVVLAGSLDDFGTFSNLTLSYTRLPHALAEDGFLPSIFTRRLRNGSPWVSVIACGLCWALALGFSFERLITIDLVLYGLSMILEFVALVLLRRNEPHLPRPFRIPGPDWVPVLLGLSPAALTVYALYASRTETVAGMSALTFALLIAVAGLPLYVVVKISKQSRSNRRADLNPES
ncbi:APC family permease [Edaphobacter modestus]|uniref:Amino acid/polyamine/organocation transporter (APC superfamily) n=1 Tax=Edaphobacter modestus TaxID=388466 RepID=A0A4Q7YRQ9_9BACT|nr:APC family permease [Edaphobacter modestus]RZU39631.1 amino acid/polyamine/organocation transporter (APC superfamily) [Edaphobacter modestus]